MGPLLFEGYKNEEDSLSKHEIMIFIIGTRPNNWEKYVDDYITALDKNSFYLFNVTDCLRSEYTIGYMPDEDLRKTSILIKKCIAKHSLGIKNPKPFEINKISNNVIPKRDKSINEE